MRFFLSVLTLLTAISVYADFPTQLQGPDVIGSKKREASAKSGAPLVVIFLSAKCPCSDSHVSELRTLVKEFPSMNWIGVHSNADEDKEVTQSYFKNVALPFPILQDEKNKWADAFKALKTPHAFVLNEKGEALYVGGVSNSSNFANADRRFLREALQDISAGKPVRTRQGRTLGCMISRGEKHVW